jgi:hypothetical protein
MFLFGMLELQAKADIYAYRYFKFGNKFFKAFAPKYVFTYSII